MYSKKRQQNPPVIRQLLDQPGRFNFWQAAGILEKAILCSYQALTPVPQDRNPQPRSSQQAAYRIRFTGNPSMSFPSGDIDDIVMETMQPEESVCYRVTSRIMGFTGATGVLPFHYTDHVLERLQHKDRVLQDFLDIFLHRWLMHFYRAGTRYRIELEIHNPSRHKQVSNNQATSNRVTGNHVSNDHVSNIYAAHDPERNNAGDQDYDVHTRTLFALAGISPADRRGLSVCPQSLLFYTGILSRQARSATSLKKLLSHYFSVDIAIEEFVASWQTCPDDHRSQLWYKQAGASENNRLGGRVLGRRFWSVQNKVRIVIGPVDGERARFFAPGSPGLRQLDELTRLYAGNEPDFEYVLRIGAGHLPLKTRLQRQHAPVLGWNAWLTRNNHANQHFDLVVAVKRKQPF